MDLFYSTLNPKESLQKLSKEILDNNKTRKKTLSTVNIALEDIGNNVLFILPNVTSLGFVQDENAKGIVAATHEFKLEKYAITYSYLLPVEHVSRDQIKYFSVWINKLIDIILPRLIVCVGENATLTFFNRKIKIENHGTIIGSVKEIPCILTLEPTYYTEHSAFEDEAYKHFLRTRDWSFIKQQYVANIKE